MRRGEGSGNGAVAVAWALRLLDYMRNRAPAVVVGLSHTSVQRGIAEKTKPPNEVPTPTRRRRYH